MTSFPASVKTFPTLVDFVDSPLAAHPNERGDEITAVERFNIGGGSAYHRYRIVPTVSANDLVLSVKLEDGTTDPSATSPLYFKIGNTVRSCTAALSVTKADGTNWANLGSAELGTIEQDLFAYAIWNTNLTPDAVDVFWSRVPYGRVYSDFSGTTTNEKYAAINATAPAATDECVCIGRFAATLSLTGTSHLWTVPTYTNVNLIHHPIFETRTLSWTPQHTRSGGAYSNLPTTALSEYQIIGRNMKLLEIHGQDATPGSSGFQRLTAPFTNPLNKAPVILASNNTTGVQMSAYYNASSNIFEMYLYDGTAQATANQNYLINGLVRIG